MMVAWRLVRLIEAHSGAASYSLTQEELFLDFAAGRAAMGDGRACVAERVSENFPARPG